MSWLTAVSKSVGDESAMLPHYHEAPLFTSSSSKFFLAAGGSPDTCFYDEQVGGEGSRETRGWAVVGMGISFNGSRASILTRDEWARLLTRESFDASSLDGHFVILRWSGGRVECYTDQLGLRTVYFCKHAGGVTISTRLDWLAQSTLHDTVDLDALGSKWLLINQIGYGSCVSGIERLGPAGHASFMDGSTLEIKHATPWLPSFESSSIQNAENIARVFTRCGLDDGHTLSLGLSGGIDSRFLLALLTSPENKRFVIHTFGSLADPDVRVADRLASTLGLRHYNFDEPLPDAHSCIEGLRDFIVQTNLFEQGSSFFKLRYYRQLRSKSNLAIDGAFGEFARRQYLAPVAAFGLPALRRYDATRLMRLMRLERADIFSAEASRALQEGACHHLEAALHDMPHVDTIGVENFVDLLTVRMRVPNYGGPEQARTDAEILNFMPLVQPSWLRSALGIPVRLRSNRSFHSQLIRTLNPGLTDVPLVKGGTTYRFGLSNNMARLVSKVKSTLGQRYIDPGADTLLNHLREFVLDTVHSAEVVENGIYDHGKVIHAVDGYYRGESHFRNTVDWWLTFELWRRALSSREIRRRTGVTK